MYKLAQLFKKDFSRSIETVIKADDQEHILQEVEEYVLTKDVSKKLADFFEAYTASGGTNGVWISGFFGSGKSHLLKILSYVLENKAYDRYFLGELFAQKVEHDAKLKADILKACRDTPSESVLFNIDQQSQTTSKKEANAVLQVFYKVFYDHQGFYGFLPHVAEFESYLSREGKYEPFLLAFEKYYHKPWKEARKDSIDPLVGEAVAEACAEVYNQDASKYEDYLDAWEDKRHISVEDFATKVNDYIESKGKNFRLNFFVDEVGQFIAENTRLMLNLQTIAESLYTKCRGRSWVLVTSQEDLESLVGNEKGTQSDDFSKIQGRFRSRMPLTSANVDEVIEKRLLEKTPEGADFLTQLYSKEGENLKTLLAFSESGIQFQGFRNSDDFVRKYPFLPYQFDLFQQCIKALSKHNAFQGRHQSVGERSMLGVFQEVLKHCDQHAERGIVSFDRMFEGIRATLHTQTQNSILLAERQLSSPLAIRVLKVLFLIKYYDSFKATSRNVSVLLLDSLDADPLAHHKTVEEALNLLENQTFIQRKGETYDFLTDVEKDVENEIKDTAIEEGSVSAELSTLIFDSVLKGHKIRYQANKQEFDFARIVDGNLQGRDRALKIEIVSPDSNRYEDDSYYISATADLTRMLIKLPEDRRLISDLRLMLKTALYVRKSGSSSNNASLSNILQEKSAQNTERKRLLTNSLSSALAKATYFLNAQAHGRSGSSDGYTRFMEEGQDLIHLAYGKLELLGNAQLDEDQLRLIMTRGAQPELFNTTGDALSEAELEVYNYLQRIKKQHDRITLASLKEHFEKPPFGWTSVALWCLVAQLYKKSKIELQQNTSILDDKGVREALNNARLWPQTLLHLQTDFDQSKVQRLQDLHARLFDETNPEREPRELALYFKKKAGELADTVRQLLNQRNQFPFLDALEGLAQQLEQTARKEYASLIEDVHRLEEDLLDDKETLLNPIQEFMNGERRKIYESVKLFQTSQQANYSMVEGPERSALQALLESPAPYRGELTRLAKEALEKLKAQLDARIQQERQETQEAIRSCLQNLEAQDAYGQLSPPQQQQLRQAFEILLAEAEQTPYIANLQNMRQRLGELYTKQLNALHQALNKQKAPDAPARPDAFVRMASVEKKLLFGKTQLRSEADVEAYLQALRQALMNEIADQRSITLN